MLAAVALVAVLVVLMLVSGGQHGPGRHTSSDRLRASVGDAIGVAHRGVVQR